MKQTVKLIVAIMMAAILPAAQVKADSKEEITLTVSSDGATKDDALKNALRTAIEQAYGAFVSANTTILNDELVKDEIVTVSNGSIKDYKEVSSFEKPDGSGYMMTVNATVSLPHLITYAKNHGSECEFAGNTFGMELKLFNLQKENELKVLYNMIPVVEDLCKTTMHWELEVSDPIIPEIIDDGWQVEFRDDGRQGINFDVDKNFLEKNLLDGFKNNPKDYCGIVFRVKFLCNGTENEVLNYIYNTLHSIEVPREMWSKYDEMGFKPGLCGWRWEMNNYYYKMAYPDVVYYDTLHFRLRNPKEEIDKWLAELHDGIAQVRLNFFIKDNNGVCSDGSFYELDKFKKSEWNEKKRYEKGKRDYGDRIYGFESGIPKFSDGFHHDADFVGCGGSGLFKWLFVSDTYGDTIEKGNKEMNHGYLKDKDYLAKTVVILPLSEINKYSSFKIIAKE